VSYLLTRAQTYIRIIVFSCVTVFDVIETVGDYVSPYGGRGDFEKSGGGGSMSRNEYTSRGIITPLGASLGPCCNFVQRRTSFAGQRKKRTKIGGIKKHTGKKRREPVNCTYARARSSGVFFSLYVG